MTKGILNIGFFSHMYNEVNGLAHAVKSMSKALAQLGHKIHIFAPSLDEVNKKYKNIVYHNLPGIDLKNGTDVELSVPIHRYLKCDATYLDIIHTHTHYSVGALGIIWGKRLGIPIIGTHSSPFSYYSTQYIPFLGKALTSTGFLWKYERWVADIYDFVHVPTKSKKELLLSNGFKEPIFYMSNGIDNQFFVDIKQNGILRKYGLEDKKLLLYVSRLSPEKHTISIIKRFHKIKKKIPNAHLVIAGSDGPLTPHVKNIVRKNTYRDYVSYLGRIPFQDLLQLYKAADLSCLWSWVEAEGLVLLEAMAQGTPNVGANGCGIRDVILHNKTGFLANSLDEFQNYTIHLLENDTLRETFGINAKQRSTQFKLSNIAKTWIKIYKFAIDEFHHLKTNNISRSTRVSQFKNYIRSIPYAKF